MNDELLLDEDDQDEGGHWQLPKGRPPPGEWADLSLCARHPNPDLWFPERGASVQEAKAICRVCPVQAECLDHALRYGERHGIWGGRSERERRRMRRSTTSNPKRGAA